MKKTLSINILSILTIEIKRYKTLKLFQLVSLIEDYYIKTKKNPDQSRDSNI